MDPVEVEIHDACACLPEMPEDQYTDLLESVRSYGILERVELYEGKVISGRHRQRAGIESGRITPGDYKDVTRIIKDLGIDPWEYARARDVDRRHMTSSQRAKAVAELLAKRRSETGRPPTRRERKAEAAKAGISETSVRRAMSEMDGKPKRTKPKDDDSPTSISRPEADSPPAPSPPPADPTVPMVHQPDCTVERAMEIVVSAKRDVGRAWRAINTIPSTQSRQRARSACLEHADGLLRALEELRISLAKEPHAGTRSKTSR